MKTNAYWYVSIAYVSIAALSTLGLVVKAFKHKFKHPEFIEYVLHGLHVPPYLIAAYWYYDAFTLKEHNT